MKFISTVILCLCLFACGQPQKTGNDSTSNTNNTNNNTTSASTIPPVKEPVADTVRQAPATPARNPYEKATVAVKTFENKTTDDANGTWGYDITIDHTPYIHQPNIPPMPGIKGFTSEAKAKKAGDFVAYKIKHNIMPPSITPQELDSLGLMH